MDEKTKAFREFAKRVLTPAQFRKFDKCWVAQLPPPRDVKETLKHATRVLSLRMNNVETGYFGTPGRVGTKVHVFNPKKGITLCGRRPKWQFQWCAHGAYLNYIDCDRCRERTMIAYARIWIDSRKA